MPKNISTISCLCLGPPMPKFPVLMMTHLELSEFYLEKVLILHLYSFKSDCWFFPSGPQNKVDHKAAISVAMSMPNRQFSYSPALAAYPPPAHGPWSPQHSGTFWEACLCIFPQREGNAFMFAWFHPPSQRNSITAQECWFTPKLIFYKLLPSPASEAASVCVFYSDTRRCISTLTLVASFSQKSACDFTCDLTSDIQVVYAYIQFIKWEVSKVLNSLSDFLKKEHPVESFQCVFL